MKKYLFIILLAFTFSLSSWAGGVRPVELRSSREREVFLNDVARLLRSHKEEVITILNEIGAIPGADYEVHQSINALEGAGTKELKNLDRPQPLKKLAIYGSSNIPLYTTVLQVLIPSLVFEKIVFKTSSKTSGVYEKLWKFLSNGLKERYDLSSVQFLSSSHRSLSQLMMNEIIGGGADKNPADMVVFTGNPENGDALVEKIKNEMSLSKISNHKIVFLKFGAGMNPVIIDTNAQGKHIHDGVRAAIEHFRVNSGQDCISPNFALLPLSAKRQALDVIRQEVKKLKFGGLQDRQADYSYLTFGTRTSIEQLVVFKDKYQKYLVTEPNALIDVETKRVEPHVFIFPASMYHELPLTEFYAPFAIFFTYESPSQLESMIKDSRLTKKAMFASLFGPRGEASYNETRKHLIRTRHLVFDNVSLFMAEDGNKPFGGFGSDVSTVDVIDVQSGNVTVKRRTHPLLISKEVRKNFPAKDVSADLVTSSLSVEKKEPSFTFGLEIEINVTNNPKLVMYYRPTVFSEEKWKSMSEAQRISSALSWEDQIRKKYKVVGYQKLSTAPPLFPKELLSESNGFFEMNGFIFASFDELSQFVKDVKGAIGEGYIQGHLVFDRKKFKGYSGLYKFLSEASIIQKLAEEQQRYHASGHKVEFLPGANFVSHSLPPPSQHQYDYVNSVEKDLLAGVFKGFSTEEEYLINKHVSAPVVRSSQGYAATYPGDLVGIENRMADWPADSPLMSGRSEKMLVDLKLMSTAIESTGDLSLFAEFQNLQSYGGQGVREEIAQFVDEYKTYFTPEELKQIDIDAMVQVFGAGNLIDGLIRSQNSHIDYGPHDTSVRLLFPLKKWHLHPVLSKIDSAEKKAAIITEYIVASKNYLLSLSQTIKRSDKKMILSEIRRALGVWSWGYGKNSYSEMITPWNMQIKSIKKKMDTAKVSPVGTHLQCQGLFF